MLKDARIALVVTLFLAINVIGLLAIHDAVSRSRPRLAVESFEPQGQTEPAAAIAIRFNEPMVPTSELGKPVTTELVAFQPELPGRFEWRNPTTLRFLPDKPLAPATAYVATVSGEFVSLAGHALADDAAFEFHTPPLALKSIAQTGTSRLGETTLALEFNDKVSPDEVARHLELTSADDKRVPYVLLGTVPSQRVVVRTHPHEGSKLLLRLAEGLRGLSGPLGLEASVRQVVDVESLLAIREVRASAQAPGDARVSVRCTQSVDTKTAAKYIEVEPKVSFGVESDWSGLELTGPFVAGQRYTLTFRKGLEATNGTRLGEDVTRTVTLPDYEPSLSFQTHGFYLSAEGSLLVPLQTVNVPKAELTIQRCYPNNVVHYLRSMEDEGERPGDFGHTVANQTYQFQAKRNEAVETLVDLKSLLGERPQGVFHLRAADPESRWRDASKLVLVTDLGLSVKRSPSDLLVWVNALSTSQPVAGVTVTVLSKANQPIAQGATNEQGIAQFPATGTGPFNQGTCPPPEEREPFLVAAAKGADSAFLVLAKSQWDTSELDADGRPYLRRGYEAFLYTDCGVYRPGSTVHLRGIVRGPGAATPPSFPVQFQVKRPDGRVCKAATATLSRWGTAELDLPLPAWARLGRYTAELRLPQGKDPLGTLIFLVEEFVPDRMKVELAAEERRYHGGETLTVTVKAKHLFGAPAAGLRVTARYRFAAEDFQPKDAKPALSLAEGGVRFADSSKAFETVNEELGQRTLDEKGEAAFTLAIPKELRPPSALRAIVTATVQELGGRAITASLERDVDLYPHYVGLARETEGAAEPQKTVRFLVQLVRPDGAPVPGEVKLAATLHQVTWNTVLRRDKDGHYRYESETEETQVAESPCAVANGSGAVAFTPPAPGLYHVRVADKATGASADLRFHCTGYGYVPWAREKPEHLELVTDKKSYAPGETARVLIKAPFPGQALVTLEGDRVHLARTLALAGNTGEFSFPVEVSHGPNVYCTVAVVRRVQPGDKWAPHRAFGTVPILLSHAPQRLQVEVGTPEETRPGGPLRVGLRVRDAQGKGAPAEVTLAAVDEGICQLTDFETPDPWDFFYGQRGLEVTTSDIYSHLMPEVEKRKVGGDSAPGGDGGPGDDERRLLNPIQAERFHPVLLWKSRIETREDGTAEVTLDVPQFIGQLRLMAVAASETFFGSAERPVLVKQPLILRTTFPRFLSPGDEFTVPVVVFNQTKQSGAVKLTLEGSPGMGLSPGGEQSVEVKQGGEAAATFTVHAPSVPGTAKLKVTARLGDEQATEEVELAIRPPATFRAVGGSGAVQAGQSAKLALPGGWFPGTAQYAIAFSTHPALKLGAGLRYLLHYPYGCIEQTTSGSLPLLYLGDVAALAAPDALGGDSVEPYVQAGIDRVLSMQTHTGGFGFWPGDRETYPWGSAYGTHFLVEARKAGFAVYKDNLDAALDYLAKYLTSERDEEVTQPVKAYACFVLALAGRPNSSWAYRLFEAREELPSYSQAHLAAAFALMKQPKMAAALLGAQQLPEATDEVDTGGLLHSSTREAAILLSVYADLDPNHRHVPALLRRIEQGMTDGRWRSTQENAFVLLGLGKHLRRQGQQEPDLTAELTVDGQSLAKFTHKDKMRLTSTSGSPRLPDNLGGREAVLAVQGKGTLYYYWTAEGVPTAGQVPEADSGLKVRRRFLARKGTPLDPAALPHGEIVVVELSIQVPGEAVVDNVVLSDLLPAGFEIENPQIATSEAAAAGRGQVPLTRGPVPLPRLEPTRVERRDDRLLLFANLEGGPTRYYRYVVRAVTRGRFALSPLTASAMYDPAITSTHGAGTVNIVGD